MPIYRPRSRWNTSLRFFLAVAGLSIWWIPLLGIAIATAMASLGQPIIFLGVAMALAANLGARFWMRHRKPQTTPEDFCELRGWLTEDQVVAFVRQAKVTTDIPKIFFETGTGGLEITGVPLGGAMSVYPDLCPPGEFKIALENLKSKTTTAWNVWRRWKNSKNAREVTQASNL